MSSESLFRLGLQLLIPPKDPPIGMFGNRFPSRPWSLRYISSYITGYGLAHWSMKHLMDESATIDRHHWRYLWRFLLLVPRGLWRSPSVGVWLTYEMVVEEVATSSPKTIHSYQLHRPILPTAYFAAPKGYVNHSRTYILSGIHINIHAPQVPERIMPAASNQKASS